MNKKKKQQLLELLKKLHTSTSPRLLYKVYHILEQEITVQCHLAVMSKNH